MVKGYHPPPEPLPASENSQDFCAGAVPPDRGGGDHQAILTAANNDDNAAYLQVPLPFHTTAEQATDLITGKSFLIDKNTNKIQIELERNSAVILGITEG